jgi:hypothetical protein
MHGSECSSEPLAVLAQTTQAAKSGSIVTERMPFAVNPKRHVLAMGRLMRHTGPPISELEWCGNARKLCWYQAE